MVNDDLLYALPYKEILKIMAKYYALEFGTRKFHTIFDKIYTSNKINSLLNTSKVKNIALNHKDYLYCLNSIPYFMFCKGQTQAMACLLALERWDIEINSQLKFRDEEQLKAIALQIIYESKEIMR